MIDVVFLALSFFAIAGGVTMLLHKDPIYCALGLLISVLSVAGLFALLSATFMFMVQIIVYAGAIMTIILFILMFLNIRAEDLPKEPRKNILVTLGVIFMIPVNLLIMEGVTRLPDADMSITNKDGFGGIHALGMKLYQEWLLPFELISILLLVALIGAVVLAKRKEKKKGINNV